MELNNPADGFLKPFLDGKLVRTAGPPVDWFFKKTKQNQPIMMAVRENCLIFALTGRKVQHAY